LCKEFFALFILASPRQSDSLGFLKTPESIAPKEPATMLLLLPVLAIVNNAPHICIFIVLNPYRFSGYGTLCGENSE